MIKTTNNKINHQSQTGFTLLEMTVALSVFLILFTLTLGVYSNTLKAERNAVQISKLQKEAQLVMELIAKKIRTNKVNYDFYEYANGQVRPLEADGETLLALMDETNTYPTIFRFNSTDNSIEVCTANCGTDDLHLSTNNFVAIPAADVIINSLTFYINPDENPFNNPTSEPAYPKVTIVAELTHTYAGATKNLIIQQTVPQRLPGP